jgi:hypothetical protein
LRLPVIADALDRLPREQKVHIHLDRMQFVDHAVLQLLITFQKQYESTGGAIFIDWERLHAHFRDPAAHARRNSGTPHRDARDRETEPAENNGEMHKDQAQFAQNGDGTHSQPVKSAM